MNLSLKRIGRGILSGIIAGLMLGGCIIVTQESAPPTPTALDVAVTETESLTATSPTTETPTETLQNLAIRVNGEGIPLDYYEGEVFRYKLAMQELGETMLSDEEIRQTVLDDIVGQALLAQAAYAGGFTISDEALDERITALAQEIGGQEALDTWMAAQGYSAVGFRWALRLSIALEWQKASILESVPEAMEQVHARQIFARTQEGADRALASLNAGTDFDEIAWEFSPQTGGELGWFPRGYLTVPVVEDAAFSLPVGEHSEIIASELGYHILLVIEKEDASLLTTDARQTLQRQALSEWVKAAKDQAQIEVLVP